MLKYLLFISIISFSFTSQAQHPLVGDWCKKYDDFTEAFKITETAEGEIRVSRYVVGNSSGENHGNYHGFWSIGASGMALVLDGEDQEVSDYRRWKNPFQSKKSTPFKALEKLTIHFYGYDKLVLSECKITKKTRKMSLDEFNSFY